MTGTCHLSAVSPVYQAESCVAELCDRLHESLRSITEDYEIILVDDGSSDDSWVGIRRQAARDARVRGLRLARNFGQHKAITAGLDAARGDWVVVLDCDLQDPPEEIPRLYHTALGGYHVVVAAFAERPEGWLRQRVSVLFWKSLRGLTGMPFDPTLGNFRIMSRTVVENFRAYREQLRFLGGITALMGFRTTSVPIRRDRRHAGTSSYSFPRLIRAAIDISMAYSDRPLKVSAVAGMAVAGLSLLAGGMIFALALAGGVTVPGWASVMVAQFLLAGLIVANLGILGYYLGRTFDKTKRRPLYVVESSTEAAAPVVRPFAAASPGGVIWITGLSGAGKSTLAAAVVAALRSRGDAAVLLDGDELRATLPEDDSADPHSRQRRKELAHGYARLAGLLAGQGLTVVVATISLFHEVHAWNRANLPGYFEVLLRVSMVELRRRDAKGLYGRFDRGEARDVPGLDQEVEEPAQPDLVLDGDAGWSPDEAARAVLDGFAAPSRRRGRAMVPSTPAET